MSPSEENTFDSKLEYIMNEFLSANNDIREMLVANQTLDYWNFMQLDRECVYSLSREVRDATTKLRNHHAERVSDLLEYVDFIHDNGDYDYLADDPTNWVVQEYYQWVHNGKQKGKCIAVTTSNEAITTAATATPTVQINLDVIQIAN